MGIMEKKMEAAIVHRDYIGIMGNKMETTMFRIHYKVPENHC